ncbi:glycosyltransferase family 2 protein [Clostridioides difficile]
MIIILVSVIIATYKRDLSLKNAIDSLMKQTYKNIEIIVVDDNANKVWNDKIKEIIDNCEKIHPIIYIKNEKNKGSAETRNIGIKEAKGEYITFLDDDDIYLPNKIHNQLCEMKKSNADFSITDLELVNESGKIIEKRTREYIEDFSTRSLLKYHLMHHITGTDTMMFRREYLIDIGGFEPIDVGDEFYLMQKAIEKGGKFDYISVCDVKAYVHTETEGLSSGESKINGENSLYEYKKKYFNELDRKSISYIKMRHYAVLAFTEIRRKKYIRFAKYSIQAVISSPIGCIKLLKNM